MWVVERLPAHPPRGALLAPQGPAGSARGSSLTSKESGAVARHPGLGWGADEGAGGGDRQDRESRADRRRSRRSLTPAAASLARGDKYWAVAARCAGWNHRGLPSR